MAQSLGNIEESYKGQTAALENLSKVMQSLDPKTISQNFSALNTALKQSQDAGDTTTESLKKMVKQQFLAGKETKSLGEQLGKTAKQALILDAAWSGLKQGFSNFMALTKGVGGALTSLTSGLFEIGTAILAIPIKILGGLVDMAAKSANGMNELAQEIENVRKQFGDLKGPGAGAVLVTTKTLKGFSDTGLSAWRVFGNLAERMKEVREAATAMGSTFSVLEKEFRDNGGAILGFQKGLGISHEEMKGVAAMAITMGKPLSKVLLETTKQSLELGKTFELDQKLIARDMGKAVGDVKHFGATTIKEIGQAAVYARKLGVELDKIVGTLDAFETFDTAAENSAKLSQSFGVTVDAFKLMEAQSPAEQIEMLRKQFKLAGVDSSNFNRQQLKLLSTTTGLDEATAKQVFSQKNQGVSLDDIKKKSESAEKKTMTQAEAMSKLADSIERMVKSGHLTGSFFDMFVKGMLAGIQNTKEFWRIMTNIQQGLQAVYFEGMRLGQAVVKLFPGLKQLFDAIGDFFEPKRFKKLAAGVTDVFIDFMKKLNTGQWSFSELMDNLKEKFFDFFNTEKPAGKKMVESFKTVLKTVSKVVAEGIKWIADKIGEGIRSITDFVKNPSKFMAQAQGAGGALGFLSEILMPLADALKHAWKVLWPAMKELFSVVAHKLWEYLKSDEFIGIIKPALPYMAAVLFGPMFTKAIVGSLVGSVGSGAIKAIAAVGKKFVGAKEVVETAGGVNKAGSAAIAGGKGWGAKDAVALGLKLVALATALAIGGIEMALAVKAMMKILGPGVGVKELEAPLIVLGAMVVAALPLMLALKLAKSTGDPADIAVGGATVALAVGIVGGVGALLAVLLRKVASPAQLEAAGGFMVKMALVFLAMVPLLAAAMVLGSVVTASSGAALIPLAVGMATISVAVGAMMASVMDIVKQLAKLQIDEGFQRKVDAFLGIMKAIQTFADTLVGLVSMMLPTFTEFITGKTQSFSEKAKAATDLLKSLIGKRGGNGIIGIVEIVINSIKEMAGSSPQVIENAKIFGEVLTAVSSAMKAMTPPDAFFQAGDSLLSHLNGPKPFADLAADVAYFSKKMTEQVFTLLTGNADGSAGKGGGLMDIIKRMGVIAQDMPAADKVASVTGLLNSLTSILGVLTPSPELVKAFSKTSSMSLLSVAGADVMKASGSKVDTKAFGEFIQTIKEQFTAMLPLLTGDTLKALIKAADDPNLSPEKLLKVSTISDAMKNVTDFSKNVSEHLKPTIQAFSLLPDMSKDIETHLTDAGIKNIVESIGRMFKASNDITRALADLKPINVAAKLAPLAAGLGLGAKGEYTIESKAVNIHVDFQITMSAADMEQALVLRNNSIVRQRLDTLSEIAGAGPRLGTHNYTQVAGNPPALTRGSQ